MTLAVTVVVIAVCGKTFDLSNDGVGLIFVVIPDKKF